MTVYVTVQLKMTDRTIHDRYQANEASFCWQKDLRPIDAVEGSIRAARGQIA